MIERQRDDATRGRRRREACRRVRASATMRGRELAGHRVSVQAEEIPDLRARDQHGDAVGEADDHRARDELAPPRPSRSAPRTTSITPAIIVHMNRPSTP